MVFMTGTPCSSSYILSPRESFVALAAFAALMVFCLALPRALSFLPALYGVAFSAFYYIRAKRFLPFDKTLLGFLLAVIALAMASSLWAPDPHYALIRALKTGCILLSCFTLIAAAGVLSACVIPRKERIVSALMLCCALAAAIFSFEYHSGFAISQILLRDEAGNLPNGIESGFLLNRSMVFLVLLCLPVFLAAHLCEMGRNRKCGLYAVLIVSLCAALAVTQSQTAQIAAILSVLMLFYPAHRRKARRFLTLCVLVALFAAPFFSGPVYDKFFNTGGDYEGKDLINDASIPHRLEVWKFISEKTMDRPFFGNGIEATRFLKSGYMMPNMNADHVMHPHNAVLQIWVEFGLTGIVLAAALIVFLLRKLDNLTPLLQRYYSMLFVVILGVLSTGYGLWQPWLLGATMALPAFSMMVSLRRL